MAADAIVVGSGPNGLAAAITLAKAGLTTVVREGQDTLGGGLRSAELTLPGYIHDVCSAVHPLAVSSPFFRTLPLSDFGLTWIHPAAPLAHPLDDGTAVMLERSLEATADRHAVRRRRLGADARALRAAVGQAGTGCPGSTASSAPSTVPHGAVRPAGPPTRDLARQPIAWHRGARAVCRQRGAFIPAAGMGGHRGVRVDAGGDGPRVGLADRPWRNAAPRRRARRVLPVAGGNDRDGSAGRAPG